MDKGKKPQWKISEPGSIRSLSIADIVKESGLPDSQVLALSNKLSDNSDIQEQLRTVCAIAKLARPILAKQKIRDVWDELGGIIYRQTGHNPSIEKIMSIVNSIGSIDEIYSKSEGDIENIICSYSETKIQSIKARLAPNDEIIENSGINISISDEAKKTLLKILKNDGRFVNDFNEWIGEIRELNILTSYIGKKHYLSPDRAPINKQERFYIAKQLFPTFKFKSDRGFADRPSYRDSTGKKTLGDSIFIDFIPSYN